MVTPTEAPEKDTSPVEGESEEEESLQREAPPKDEESSPAASESANARKEIRPRTAGGSVQKARAAPVEEPPNPTGSTPTPPSTPPPTLPDPPRCWGVRAYDDGYFDVGSFYIFHPEALLPVEKHETGDGMPKGKDSAEGVAVDRTESSSVPRPFGFQFLAGLKVVDGRDGKEAAGGSSDEAVQAFVGLERQVSA